MTEFPGDQQLVKQFQNGTEDERKSAFSELYRHHEKGLRWYLTRMTQNRQQAEDIAQEAFVKALNGLDDYEPRATFKIWLFQIATNTLRNTMKKKRPSPGVKEEMTRSKTSNPGEAVEQRETRKEVRDAVDQLSESLRSALVLVQFEGMKYKQAAQVLDISLSALKARMSRAYQKLNEMLEE